MPTGRRKGAPWAGLPTDQFKAEVQRLWPDDVKQGWGFGIPFLFGDGSDGNVTVTGTTNLTSHDIKQYLNLTIAAGGTLTTTETHAAVLILYVRERLYVAGTIDMNGNGGNTADGDDANRYAGSGGGGGGSGTDAGADGKDTINAGGAGGTTGNVGTAGSALSTAQKTNVRMRTDARNLSINSMGAAGGRGGSAGAPNGGASGDGGGGIHIYANEVSVAATGVIRAHGANGGNASAGNDGGGGGGGGGFIYIVTRKLTNSGGSITVTAGSGGTGIGGGAAGGAGGAGVYILEQVP